MLVAIRSVFGFEYFSLLLSCVEYPPTRGQNLVFLRSSSCHVNNNVLVFFDNDEKLIDLRLIVPAILIVQLLL